MTPMGETVILWLMNLIEDYNELIGLLKSFVLGSAFNSMCFPDWMKIALPD